MSASANHSDQTQTGLWLCVGLLVGLLISAPAGWHWLRQGEGTRVAVLGAGKHLSVLITHDQRRVLIAAGNDGPAFSNALSAALPPIGDSIDVVLLESRVSADVGERARGLAAKRVLYLPSPELASGTSTVQESFVIDLSGDVLVSFRIEPDHSWSASVQTSAGSIAITPGRPARNSTPVAISLDGTDLDDEGRSGVGIGPRAGEIRSGSHLATVAAGSAMSIRVDGGQFRLPRDYFDLESSGERANHFARLNRKLLLEF